MLAGHGSLVSPAARNAFDRSLPRYAGGKNSMCNCGNVTSGCDVGLREHMSGQACFWFSQGCFIGCATCDNRSIQPDGMDPRAPENNSCVRGSQPAGSTSQPTLPHRLWSMNRAAVESSNGDIFRYHPWRAPGSAPVTDACGMAGGTIPKYAGPGHTFFSEVDINGSTIKLGDLGTKVLRKGPAAAIWKAGTVVEAKWGLRFNHGGGYQYRLCPANEELNEDCFQRNPLDFDPSKQALEWKNGTRMLVPDPQYVDEGIIPVGSTWARNPIPMITAHPDCGVYLGDPNQTDSNGMLCRQFDPPCPQDDGWFRTPGAAETMDTMGLCSGDWVDGVIVDGLMVPADLAPGDYVLGFRWDCEQTSQVWSSCADITVIA